MSSSSPATHALLKDAGVPALSKFVSASRRVPQVVRKLALIGAAHYLLKPRLLRVLLPFVPGANLELRPSGSSELFAENLDWIDNVRLLIIELHGPESARTFHRAMEGRPFKISVCGELTIAERVHAA